MSPRFEVDENRYQICVVDTEDEMVLEISGGYQRPAARLYAQRVADVLNAAPPETWDLPPTPRGEGMNVHMWKGRPVTELSRDELLDVIDFLGQKSMRDREEIARRGRAMDPVKYLMDRQPATPGAEHKG